MTRPKKKTTPSRKTRTNPSEHLRQRILDDAKTLKVPLSAEFLDAALARADQEGLAHLNFLELIFGEPAARSRQRAIERRIREAKFREDKNLTDFDWKFNGQVIDRAQIEQLATGEFLRRHENLVMVGQSGVGKSHLLQALARHYCELGYRVRYTTSADLLEDLRASLADQTLPHRIGYWSRFDLVIIDEFGFDRIERSECPQAANLFYKVIDARSGQRSTALATNIDFEAWSEYLGDPPLAMAFLDRIVDGAILLKICGKSYRARPRQETVCGQSRCRIRTMPGIDYPELRRQITMREVLDLIGFQPTSHRGPQLRGPCLIPSCPSTSDRSFSVHLTRQVYHCFACRSRGNALDSLGCRPRLAHLPGCGGPLARYKVQHCISRPITQPLSWPPLTAKLAPFPACATPRSA